LYDILDPNRRVDPQFSEYVAVTTDGRILNGLLAAENSDSVTLRQPEGREVTILRGEIEELRATNRSLMPEGIEKEVTVDQMADVLAFLKNR
jgi:putative heme-binding domain-containing protein